MIWHHDESWKEIFKKNGSENFIFYLFNNLFIPLKIYSYNFSIININLQIFARVFGEFGWDTELLGVGLPDFMSKELGLEIEVFGVGLPDLKSNETDLLLMWLWGVV